MSVALTTFKLAQVHPGELAFEKAPVVIETLLGSCVAVTLYNRKLRVGGLCHYLLAVPQRQVNKKNCRKYAVLVLPELFDIAKSHSNIDDFQFGLFGGSDIFPTEKKESIGKSNINFALNWLKERGLKLSIQDTGGYHCRRLSLDLNTGDLTVKSYQMESEKVYS